MTAAPLDPDEWGPVPGQLTIDDALDPQQPLPGLEDAGNATAPPAGMAEGAA